MTTEDTLLERLERSNELHRALDKALAREARLTVEVESLRATVKAAREALDVLARGQCCMCSRRVVDAMPCGESEWHEQAVAALESTR